MKREERAAQLWKTLVLAARNRQTLTYDLVARAAGVPRAGVGAFLGPIQSYCQQNELPPLTALVVSEESGTPGDGFIAAADIPKAQAQVFRYNWLERPAPSPEKLDRSYSG